MQPGLEYLLDGGVLERGLDRARETLGFALAFPALAAGCTLVLRDRFSATAWLDDVRTHGVTFTSTVGRALGYILATPPTPGDRDHNLRVVLAPEASPRDSDAFRERFGARVISGYGSSEGGIALMPAAKRGSLGTAPPGADIAVVTEDGRECETARFDENGRLINTEQATGELVRRDAAGSFEGYWDNPEADADRLRDAGVPVTLDRMPMLHALSGVRPDGTPGRHSLMLRMGSHNARF